MNSRYSFVPDANTGRLTEDDTKKYISRLFWAVAIFEVVGFAVTYLLALAVSAVCTAVNPALLDSGSFVSVANHLISMLSTYCVGLPVFCIITSVLPSVTPKKKKMGAKSWILGLCVCFAFMYIGNYISTIVLQMLESMLNISTTNPLDTIMAESNVIIDVVFIVIVAPIPEEIFFRKIVCDRLLPLGEGYAIVLSALIFGLGHGNFYQFAYSFLVGFIFALVYVKTGKLAYSIVYHVIFNLVGAVLVPYLIKIADLEKTIELLFSESPSEEELVAAFERMIPYAVYALIYLAAVIIGTVALLKAVRMRRIRFARGELAPFEKKKVTTVLCTVGMAASITVYVAIFVMSLAQ